MDREVKRTEQCELSLVEAGQWPANLNRRTKIYPVAKERGRETEGREGGKVEGGKKGCDTKWVGEDAQGLRGIRWNVTTIILPIIPKFRDSMVVIYF